MTLKEIRNLTLPPEKRKTELWDIWSYVNRPVGYVITKLLLHTKISPTVVTIWSVIACVPGFALLAFGNNTTIRCVGWLFYFIWIVLDNVDGGLARCRQQSSKKGELWDAFGGYIAMVSVYFASGIAGFYDNNIILYGEPYIQIILGASTSILSILPRIVMQKKKNLNIDVDSTNKLANKQHFGIVQLIAMNIISVGGFMQVILLFCILFHLISIFNLVYFVIMVLFSLKTLYSLLIK